MIKRDGAGRFSEGLRWERHEELLLCVQDYRRLNEDGVKALLGGVIHKAAKHRDRKFFWGWWFVEVICPFFEWEPDWIRRLVDRGVGREFCIKKVMP